MAANIAQTQYEYPQILAYQIEHFNPNLLYNNDIVFVMGEYVHEYEPNSYHKTIRNGIETLIFTHPHAPYILITRDDAFIEIMDKLPNVGNQTIARFSKDNGVWKTVFWDKNNPYMMMHCLIFECQSNTINSSDEYERQFRSDARKSAFYQNAK